MEFLDIFKRSIKAKMLVSTIPVIVLMIVVLSTFLIMRQKSSVKETAHNQVKIFSEMLSFSVGAGLQDANFDLVQTTVNWAKDDESVVYISILGDENEELFSHNPQNLTIPEFSTISNGLSEDNGMLIAKEKIVYKDTEYGNIILYYSLDKLNSEITSSVQYTTILSLIILAIGSFLFVLRAKVFANQIIRLRDAAHLVGEGDLEVDLKCDSIDEIGDLCKSFGKMVDNISKYSREVEEQKASVERKVEEAVKQSEEHAKYLDESTHKMLEAMDKFQNGDLTVNLFNDKNDEIGRLFDGFNFAVDNIREMVMRVSKAVEKTAEASQHIASTTSVLSDNAQRQGHQTNEVAAAVEEMTSTIMETSQNTNIAAESARNSGDTAYKGGEVVKMAADGMIKTAQVVAEAAQTVENLGESSQQIGEIILVINDIADQTNLLALNAAIEAARAGEQGRGFAVVADEVRKLAERTTKATKEISGMIQKIQTETETSVKSIHQGKAEAENGTKLAEEAGTSLHEIIDSSNSVVDIINQVAVASEEQSSAAQDIGRSIETINQVTGESVSSIQDVAASVDELKQLTDDLQTLIQRFKL